MAWTEAEAAAKRLGASAAGARARARTILHFLTGAGGGRRPSGASPPLRPVGCMRGRPHSASDSLLDGKIGEDENLALQIESSALAARQ